MSNLEFVGPDPVLRDIWTRVPPPCQGGQIMIPRSHTAGDAGQFGENLASLPIIPVPFQR